MDLFSNKNKMYEYFVDQTREFVTMNQNIMSVKYTCKW